MESTIRITQDGVWAGDGILRRLGDGSVDIECMAILGPDVQDHESGAQQDAAERAYDAIKAAVESGKTSVVCDGCTYEWEIEDPPEPKVLGLGEEDWTAEDARGWMRYGTVQVQLGDVVYEVGVAIGVPEYLRATAEAAGGDKVTPYLSVWYIDPSDWSCAPASDGTSGVSAEWRQGVLVAIGDAAQDLWTKYVEE